MRLLLGACAGLAGNEANVYQSLSDDDVRLAARLLQQTLETAPDATTRRWVNQETGHHGSITPVRTYLTEGGYFCRDYREELSVGGQTGRFEHSACRNDAARWVWL